MTELKTVSSGEIYDIIEYEDCSRTDDLYYPKQEADKVIAELEDKLRHLPMMAALLETDKDELRYQKYKRCLDKAKWCDERIARYQLQQAVQGILWQSEIKFYRRLKDKFIEISKLFEEPTICDSRKS